MFGMAYSWLFYIIAFLDGVRFRHMPGPIWDCMPEE